MKEDSTPDRAAGLSGPEDTIALDRSLEEVAASIEAARTLLALRKTVGGNLRMAIRRLLDAQERIESEGPSQAARLDLLEAIRLVGVVEQEIKASVAGDKAELAVDVQNRRAFRRQSASFQIELEPEHRTGRSDLTSFPLNGVTVNVSKGGMLAKLEQGILRHGRYLVRFVEVGGAVKPEVTWGAVRRSRARNRGWEVGIEFDDPLDILQ